MSGWVTVCDILTGCNFIKTFIKMNLLVTFYNSYILFSIEFNGNPIIDCLMAGYI